MTNDHSPLPTFMHSPDTPEQLIDLVRSESRVRVVAGGSKPATHGGANVSLAGLSGMVQYEPTEYTFTALAGTPIAEVEETLAAENQYLPFDPPLVQAGATLGGTVAAGLSGAGRYRYGGVRDFLIGARIITGDGQFVTTGSKVVKNAAGFDLPKLMVGSLGTLGLMVELTFKVFPRPRTFATVVARYDNASAAIDTMRTLATSQLDLDLLDMDNEWRVWARVGGLEAAIVRRAERVRQVMGDNTHTLCGDDELATWQRNREFDWVPDGYRLVKVVLTPGKMAALVERLADVRWRISVGGHLAWIAWPADRAASELDQLLKELACPAAAITGEWPAPALGKPTDEVFRARLQAVLDFDNKFALN